MKITIDILMPLAAFCFMKPVTRPAYEIFDAWL
jgi:hypothetical protein